MKKQKESTIPRFYDRSKRHVRGKKSGRNRKGAKLHPALIVGETDRDYLSMGMTTTEPYSKKARKKFIKLKLIKSKDGKASWLRKQIDQGNKRSYSPETYGGFRFTEEEQSLVDKQVSKKAEYITKKRR